MTSIPASRSARATTFAPRSWPSRPGLATTTRIREPMCTNLQRRPPPVRRTRLPVAHRDRLVDLGAPSRGRPYEPRSRLLTGDFDDRKRSVSGPVTQTYRRVAQSHYVVGRLRHTACEHSYVLATVSSG